MIDGRLSEMYFRHRSGKNIYVWRKKDRSYDVGINGTSYHYHCADKYEAEVRVRKLSGLANELVI